MSILSAIWERMRSTEYKLHLRNALARMCPVGEMGTYLDGGPSLQGDLQEELLQVSLFFNHMEAEFYEKSVRE